MIEESDSYVESYVASDEENYVPAANGGTGTPKDSNIEQEMIIEQKRLMRFNDLVCENSDYFI